MAIRSVKPVGFDNWRKHWFKQVGDGGDVPWVLASFFLNDSGEIKLYRGPNILSSTSGAGSVITTEEPHGLVVGQEIYIQGHSAELDGAKTITSVPNPDEFTTGDTTSATATGGIVGVRVPGYRPTANIAQVIVGDRFIDTYPEAWQGDWEG